MDMNIDFESLTPPTSPNYAIVCPYHIPRDDCIKSAPELSVNIDSLKTAWQRFIKTEERITELPGAPENQLWYVQRTKWLRFPDYVVVSFYALAEDKSTVGLYSRSKYGYSDFGVNRKRVERWLEGLEVSLKNQMTDCQEE